MNKYSPGDKIVFQVESTFRYHSPKGDQAERYEYLRLKARDLAMALITNCPESRELSAALTLLQNCTMMANASIACNE